MKHLPIISVFFCFLISALATDARPAHWVSKDIQTSNISTNIIACDETGHCYLILKNYSFQNLKTNKVIVTARANDVIWRRLAYVQGKEIKIKFSCSEEAKKYAQSYSWTIEQIYR